MIICGQEFEFSALNANDLDRMDAAQQHMQAASDHESKRVHTGTADILRGQCRLMMSYFDELLGEGASARLGLDGNNFGACVRVTNAIKEAIAAEQATVKQAAAMPMNREQQRAAAKQQQRKQKPVSRSEGFHPQVASRPDIPYEQWGTMTQHDAAELREIDKDARRKTDQLIDARQAVDALRDDPDAMQQLAAYALQLAAERHV